MDALTTSMTSQPIVGSDEEGPYMKGPYEAPPGKRWRFTLIADAGSLEQQPGWAVFDGGYWTCSLVDTDDVRMGNLDG